MAFNIHCPDRTEDDDDDDDVDGGSGDDDIVVVHDMTLFVHPDLIHNGCRCTMVVVVVVIPI
jgi:hypothetical protein